MRVLLAFDKFKDSMSAMEACTVAASAIRRIHPDWELEVFPLSDGSDGFAPILTQNRQGEMIYATVNGPLFKPVEACFGMVDCSTFTIAGKAYLKLPDNGSVAVVEMAQASGLALLDPEERNLWHTSTYGTGEVLSVVFKLRPALVILGLGGSATHDMGLGALEALGLRYRLESGDIINHLTPNDWPRVVALEGELPHEHPRIILAPNTQNKLLGSKGAAALFGPQKGLRPGEFARLEEQTQRMAELILGHFGAPRSILEAPGSGAAGGMSVGLQAAFHAEMIPGVEIVDRWLKFNESLEKANIVVTGEGRFDLGSLEGKVPEYVISKASNRGKRIYCFVGQTLLGEQEKLPEHLMEAHIETIAPSGVSAEKCMDSAIEFLSQAIKRVFADVR
jgi:glycerate kinase